MDTKSEAQVIERMQYDVPKMSFAVPRMSALVSLGHEAREVDVKEIVLTTITQFRLHPGLPPCRLSFT